MSYSVEYKDIGLKDYKETWDFQSDIFTKLVNSKIGVAEEERPDSKASSGTLIIVEHPHVYTLGKSGRENNLFLDERQLQARGASFYRIDRGGDITYHGPGQIVGYPIFDLEALGTGLKDYIFKLEEAIIRTVGAFDIEASRLEGGTGVWLDPESKEKARKICAIGVRASRYVTMHGFAFNVNTDLAWFSYMNPCGFTDKGVTSLSQELGGMQDIDLVKKVVKEKLQEVFDIEWTNR